MVDFGISKSNEGTAKHLAEISSRQRVEYKGIDPTAFPSQMEPNTTDKMVSIPVEAEITITN